MRYLLHNHPAFPGLLSKEDLYTLVERGSLARGDLCTDVQTGHDHTVGDAISGMRPPHARAPARIDRPAYQEFRADDPFEAVDPMADGEGEDEADDEEESAEAEARYTASGERLYFSSHPAWLRYWRALFLMLLFFAAAGMLFSMEEGYALVCGLAGIATFICITIARSSHDYIVTEERVEYVWGIFGRSSKEVRVCDIRSLDVWEKGLKGWLGLGTLDVSSAGNAGVEVSFRDIRRAHEVKQVIRQLQRGDGE
ncbi:MAG: PH domain-containing protein [Verrucomicrobiota bacterium]